MCKRRYYNYGPVTIVPNNRLVQWCYSDDVRPVSSIEHGCVVPHTRSCDDDADAHCVIEVSVSTIKFEVNNNGVK